MRFFYVHVKSIKGMIWLLKLISIYLFNFFFPFCYIFCFLTLKQQLVVNKNDVDNIRVDTIQYQLCIELHNTISMSTTIDLSISTNRIPILNCRRRRKNKGECLSAWYYLHRITRNETNDVCQTRLS